MSDLEGVKLVEPAVPQHVVDAFERRYGQSFDLARDDHEWRNTWRYKHDHVQSRWVGWRDGYLTALSPSPVPAPLPGSGETKSNYPEIPDGWRDIASAPMDGTYIIAFPVLSETACVVVWERAVETPPMMRAKGENIDHSGYWRLPMTGKPTPYQPTHWRPLPAPPALQANPS